MIGSRPNSGNAQSRRTASAEGWAEEIGVLADGIPDGCATAGEFPTNFGGALEDQQGMGEGVIADHVSSFGNFAGDVGTLANIVTDQEESCFLFVASQDFKQV